GRTRGEAPQTAAGRLDRVDPAAAAGAHREGDARAVRRPRRVGGARRERGEPPLVRAVDTHHPQLAHARRRAVVAPLSARERPPRRLENAIRLPSGGNAGCEGLPGAARRRTLPPPGACSSSTPDELARPS